MADIRLTDAEREALVAAWTNPEWSLPPLHKHPDRWADAMVEYVTAALAAVPRLALSSPMVGEAGLALLVTRRHRLATLDRLRHSAMVLKRGVTDPEHRALMDDHYEASREEHAAFEAFDLAALTGEEARDAD